jgi:CHASE3 domain sensor protein
MRWTIGKKLGAGFGIILLLIVVFGIVVLVNIASVKNDFSSVVEHDTPILIDARQLVTLISSMEAGQGVSSSPAKRNSWSHIRMLSGNLRT